jgi:hypothetical protein
MKKIFCAALLGLAFLAQPARAGIGCGSGGCSFGLPGFCVPSTKIHFSFCNPCCPSPGCGCGYGGGWGGAYGYGPWYLYWPLEAHFQAPAVPSFPYWPAPMTLPSAAYNYPMAAPQSFSGPGFQSVSYYSGYSY